MKKIIAASFVSLMMIGCTATNTEHLLNVDSALITKAASTKMQIAVDKVSVPTYLQDIHIAIRNEQGSIDHKNAIWSVPTEKALTQTLIASLQEKFDNPNVKLYPWDIEKEIGVRIRVKVLYFLYEHGETVLQSSYSIGSIASDNSRSYRFSTTVPSSNDSNSIVDSMNEAFSMLVNDIGSHLQ